MHVDPTGQSIVSTFKNLWKTVCNGIESACNGLKSVYNKAKTVVNYLSPLSNEEKVLVSTIAAESTVTSEGKKVSSQARQAMANVALNRVGGCDWEEYDNIIDICAKSGFDGYGDKNYRACMNYLDQRDFKNKTYEAIIWDVMLAYTEDITNGCQLYYTPSAMTPPGSKPFWDFSLLTEVIIDGVDRYYEGRFYKYN